MRNYINLIHLNYLLIKKKKKNKIISVKIVWFKIGGGKWGILI